MSETQVPQSPVHEHLDTLGAEWRSLDRVEFAVRIRDDDTETTAMRSLGLCDLSGLPKVGIKGPGAKKWLESIGIEVPKAVFDSQTLGADSLIVRTGVNEFFLEDGIGNPVIASLADRVNSDSGQLFRVEHQEATFLLTGSRSIEVLAQTCGINFREASQRKAVFTRVAGVSCAVFPDVLRETPAYRIWVDPSFAVYLWETLVEICESLDGSVIGAGCVFPELISQAD